MICGLAGLFGTIRKREGKGEPSSSRDSGSKQGRRSFAVGAGVGTQVTPHPSARTLIDAASPSETAPPKRDGVVRRRPLPHPLSPSRIFFLLKLVKAALRSHFIYKAAILCCRRMQCLNWQRPTSRAALSFVVLGSCASPRGERGCFEFQSRCPPPATQVQLDKPQDARADLGRSRT